MGDIDYPGMMSLLSCDYTESLTESIELALIYDPALAFSTSKAGR